MTKTSKWVAGIGAAVVAVGAAMLKLMSPTTVEPFCYRDQIGTELRTNHGLAGRTVDTGSGAHGTGIIGEDGIKYNLFDQCPTSGPEHRYQRPQASAGPLAIAWWEWYWTNPSATWNRCYTLPTGIRAPYPPPPRTECVPTYQCKVMPPVQAGTFAPRVYECGVPITPVPTVVPPGPTPVCAPCPPCVGTPPPVVRTPTRVVPTPNPRPTRPA